MYSMSFFSFLRSYKKFCSSCCLLPSCAFPCSLNSPSSSMWRSSLSGKSAPSSLNCMQMLWSITVHWTSLEIVKSRFDHTVRSKFLLVLCWPTAASKYSNASTERRCLPKITWTFNVKQESFKIARLLNDSVFQQFFFNRREYIQISKYASYKSCVKHKLDVCKDTSRTPVKRSLNCART